MPKLYPQPKCQELAWWLTILLTGIVILLCPTYLRGSDQYWYTADAVSISHGFHLGTNNLYPNSFTGNWYAPQRPFVHNRPIIYLVGLVNILVHNSVLSWKLVNVLLLSCTVIFVRNGTEFLLAENYGKDVAKRFGLIAGIVYLFMPFNFWLVFQPLSTIADGFFIAFIFLYIFPRWAHSTGRRQIGWWILLLVISTLAVFGREDHLLMLVLGTIAWLCARRQLWSKYIFFIPALLAGVWLCSPLFPGHLIIKFPIYRLILESRPGYSNMVSFLDPHIGNYTVNGLIQILIPKAFHNLRIQFIPAIKLVPFYYTFNFLIVIIIAGIALNRKKRIGFDIKSYCWLTIGMLISFLILILAYQNQYRYMISILPVATAVGGTLCIFWYMSHKRFQKKARLVAIMMVLLLLIMDVSLTYSGLRSAKYEQQQAHLLGQELNMHMGANEVLISEWSGNAQVIGYVHPSAPCLYVDKAYILEHPLLLEDPAIKWVVTGKNSDVQIALKDKIAASYELPQNFVLNKLKR